MKVFQAICITDHEVTGEVKGEPGKVDTLRLKRGQEYAVSHEHEDGTRTVFSSYWARVPAAIFAGVRDL